MKPELQRIKIAEACGWEWRPYEGGAGTWHFGWFDPTGKQHAHSHIGEDKEKLSDCLPDYLNDLNAMAKAEKSIGEKNLYRKFLYLVVLDDPENIANEPAWATAAQRAEAFLRTLGLWEEES